jgi:hypothetical protein
MTLDISSVNFRGESYKAEVGGLPDLPGAQDELKWALITGWEWGDGGRGA